MRNEFEFTAAYPDGDKHVRVSIPSGLPELTWFVYIDKYYYGRIERHRGRWISVDLKQADSADVPAIGERIDQFLRDNGADEDELYQGAFNKW